MNDFQIDIYRKYLGNVSNVMDVRNVMDVKHLDIKVRIGNI